MRRIKNGEKFTAMYNITKFSGVAQELDGVMYLWHNSKTISRTTDKKGPKGYPKKIPLMDHDGVSHVMVGTSSIFNNTVCGYVVTVEDNDLIFGCGDLAITKAQLRQYVIDKAKGLENGIVMTIDDAMISNDIDKVTLEDCEKLDIILNNKVTSFSKQLLSCFALPDFKTGDFFTAVIDGDRVSGKVIVDKTGKITLCHNNEDFNEDGEGQGYPYSTIYESVNNYITMGNLKKVTAKDVEEPAFMMEIGGNPFEVVATKDKIIFGCGDVTLTKTQILNWLEIHKVAPQKLEDYKMVEVELLKRDDSFDNLDSDDLARLEKLCKS